MNRHEKRRQAKLSRNATPAEIFPDARHGPVQTSAELVMKAMLQFVEEHLPGFGVTVFLNERAPPPGESRLPRFNYASTENREDMYAVLAAFLQKNKELAPKLDKIAEAPPTGARN